MQVQVAETGPCSRTLTITVPPQLVDEHLTQMYASAQQQIQLKGFRPGKVPKDLVQKRFGKAILEEAKEQLLNRYFGEACRQKEIQPVGSVSIDGFEKLAVAPGTALQFVAVVDVKPVVTLGTVKGLEASAFEPDATDADVDNALKEIAHQKRAIKPTSEAAQDGDFVKGDVRFLDAAGAVVRERKGTQLNTRIAIHGCDEATYTKALLGATAGAELRMPITYPDTFEQEAVRGQSGTVVVQATEILRVTPAPIDDELAKGLEFGDLAALRQDLSARISGEKQRLGKQRQEEQCLQKLLDTTQIPLPASLVQEQKRASLGQFAHRLKESGMADADIEAKLKESDAEAQSDAERRVRLFFLIEAVAKQQKLFVTETDVEGELKAIAAANSQDGQTVTAQMVRDHLEKQNQLGELRLALLERKVRDFLRENAKIVDTKGS